ncbi:MAG: holo-ACP synthase [Actinomycetota bacterium]|nr:holo-ACP synthase [Actinomycetota bacterium]MDA8207938.1 holo-ACP synthase [Actinomycetota bacterium]
MSEGSVIIGIGVDLVEHLRMAELIARRPRALERMFTPAELEYADRFKGEGRVARLAARFAAKEAVSKALGINLFSVALREISVVPSSGGAPVVLLQGRCRELARLKGVEHVSLSISHERSNSIAFAVAFGHHGGERPAY